MRGKRICETLKKVRLDIARANNIKYELTECSHKGECLGTCPKCESEVRYLERQIELRRKRGLKITLAGVSAGLVAISTASCANPFEQATAGDMEIDPALRQSENTEPDLLLGEAPLSAETGAVDGEMPIPGETADSDAPETEVVLEGDVAYFPEDSEAFTDVMVAGMMVAPEDADVYRTEGDIIAPTEECDEDEELCFESSEAVDTEAELPETTS